MTKEQIYVHIKSEDEANRAKEILEKWGENIGIIQGYITFPYLALNKFSQWSLFRFLDSHNSHSRIITLDELDQLLAQEHGANIGSATSKENLQVPETYGGSFMVYPNSKTEVPNCSEKSNSSFNPQPHYKNDKKEFRSLFELQTVLDLNSYEFDILKRLVRCRQKGQFAEDLQKIKDTVDIYLNEFKG